MGGSQSRGMDSSTKERVDELVCARWVIPVDTEEVLEHHTVAIRDGKILAIMPTDDALKAYQAPVLTEKPNCALLPGFINAHGHSPMVLLRGVSDDIPLHEWLMHTIWPLEHRFVNEEFVREGSVLAICEMLLGGTTCFNDMYWFPESVVEAAVSTGIRLSVGIIAIQFPFGAYGSGPDEYIEKGMAAREKYKEEPLVSWTVAPHAPYTVSDETFKKLKEIRDELQCPLHIHLHETAEEPAKSASDDRSPPCHLSEERCTPLANFKRMGMLDDKLIAVHMVHLSDEEVQWCGEAGATIVHCPSSNLKLASGFARIGDLLKEGANVAIGTDGASSNNTLDMMAEMKLAAMLAKAVSKNAEVVPAATALRMATLNGAKALGIQEVTGSLTVGKDADMIAVDLHSSPETWPAPTTKDSKAGFDPVTHLVYSSTRNQVQDVWVRGRCLLRDRQLLTANLAEVEANAKKWGERISAAVSEMRAAAENGS